MKIIEENPYRLLGVYSNSPTKERVANHNRLKAFLNVGRQVDFPLDLALYISPVNRTLETVARADTELALPKDQLKYAQFWFIKITPLDEIAFNHLQAGNMDAAIGFWKKKDCASSLQNRIVCALIKGDYSEAFINAKVFYSQYVQDFVTAIVGDSRSNYSGSIAFDFLDTLIEELGANAILPFISDEDWKNHIVEKTVKPLIEKIQSAIDVAKSSRGNGSAARYKAGVKLMNATKGALQQLKVFLSATDLQYQMIADKLGLEILQCGIDYFNDSDDNDAAYKAMELQKYAQSIVVGRMAKDRCKENVNILQRIINNLPPTVVLAEDRAIKEELKKFCNLPDTISHAVTLLNNTKPYLQTIKTKLGASNAYYLKISTQIVGNALHNVIEEVNDVQSDANLKIGLERVQSFLNIKRVLYEAWIATRIMDTFDMEQDFKVNRYDRNRRILKDMYDKIDSISSQSKSGGSDDDFNWGCVIPILILVIVALISMCS